MLLDLPSTRDAPREPPGPCPLHGAGEAVLGVSLAPGVAERSVYKLTLLIERLLISTNWVKETPFHILGAVGFLSSISVTRAS